MKVINIAVKRDGKVENDTLYLPDDVIVDQNYVNDIALKLDCDVILSHIGNFKTFADKTIKNNTWLAQKIKEVDNG